MIVATRAFDAHAQKHLADVGGDIVGLRKFGDVVEIRCRVEIEIARRRDELGGELIVRLILHHGLAKPGIHEASALGALVKQAHAQQGAEPRGPNLGELRPLH